MTAPGPGDVIVCVLGAGSDEQLRERTPPGVPILEVDSPADAFARAVRADVVLLHPGTLVPSGWLEGMREAAYAAATTASASALTQPELAPERLEQAAAAVRTGSLRLRPRIEAPAGACVYVRRSAIDLIGSAGGDFEARCVERGLAHVLADDVLVFAPAPATPLRHQPSPPEARATAAARRALRGVSATIDARILYGPTTGTHVHVLELIAALARTEQVHLTAILPDQPSEDALSRLRAVPRLTLVTYRDAPRTDSADIVHRPFQLSNAGDLGFLQALGDRVILTQQDLIAFHNPAYFPATAAWQDYRGLTRLSLATADRVLFFSDHVRDDALAEELVDRDRASVVHLGVDHPSASTDAAPPAAADAIQSRPYLLCLGTDFLHKNRPFALRLLSALVGRGTDVGLVLAGPSVAHGSSRSEEARFLAAHPELAGRVRDLGPVAEAEKRWLYDHAALVVYPSVVEGFGLVPFEAAAHRVACLWASGSSLSELLPDEAAGIVAWDEQRTAENALALMRAGDARERNLNAIGAAAAGLTWDATAQRMIEVYRETAAAPARPRSAGGMVLSEDAARLVGPGGELPADVHRPLLALATRPKIARPVYAALKLGYRLRHRRR
ncbi:MAG: glycosyltransferase family 4 protein [Solirubrobacterales bacterium]|nr:glycosyltransferase family 4 protein [Solirubrobacterales bacterium]